MPGPMQQKTDAELWRDRLMFYREEMSEINATLRGFLQRAKAERRIPRGQGRPPDHARGR